MDKRKVEPRTVMWAMAEISWEDANGIPSRAPATLEDTSPSGACLRVKRPFAVGSKVTVKWSREQFRAIARNCRTDGREFLLGVRRDTAESRRASSPFPATIEASPAPTPSAKPAALPVQVTDQQDSQPSRRMTSVPEATPANHSPRADSARPALADLPSPPELQPPPQDSLPGQERKVMSSKPLFSKFWRRPSDISGTLDKTVLTEAPMNKSTFHATEGLTSSHHDLLSYEDIYHAAGIMSPRSGYGIHKVVEMLNSGRIRDLAKEAKRASVLMALDAAGTSVDQLLQDATRRQQALNAYEAGQRKQLEEFEAMKSRENAQIEAEMDRIRAHYAERIQHNHDEVVKEKEDLRNWQSAMQHEMQRIAEVIELCGNQPAPALAAPASATPTSPAEKPASSRAHTAP